MLRERAEKVGLPDETLLGQDEARAQGWGSRARICKVSKSVKVFLVDET